MKKIGLALKLKAYIERKLKNNKKLRDFIGTQEFWVFMIISVLFFIVILRLFIVQVVQHKKYDDVLNSQHITQSSLQASRGSIYAYDKANNAVKLTENISLYNVYVDPKYIGNKARFIELLTPVVYEHLCVNNGMTKVEKIDCIKNIETFAGKDLLPKEPEFFYMGDGIVSDGYYSFDWTGYYEQVQKIVDEFTTGAAENLIMNGLDKRVQIGIKEQNYLGFFENVDFLDDLRALDLPFINIKYTNYVYVVPSKVSNVSKDSAKLKAILKKYGYDRSYASLDKYFSPQENRYVKILSNVNSIVAQMVKDLKTKYYSEKTPDNVPILHGLGLETNTIRYYPYGSFLSNILGYVDKNGSSFYGVEQYFDDRLRGQNGKIVGRSSQWIGGVGANGFEVEDVINGDDIYLTIDIGIQKEVEAIVKKWQQTLAADSISVLVYDPMNGQIKASAQYPTFDPNDYNDAYLLRALSVDDSYIIDGDTYVDIPVYIKTGGETRVATTTERADTTLQKYLAKNIYGSQVFVDKNVASTYEPGSVFKAFTVAIGLDSDEISLYDFYNDPGEVKVGQYTIKNADNKNCMGEKTFMNAFVFSCNIGMVRIVQAVGKNNYYNYLKKLGFGKTTNIELGGEVAGSLDDVTTVSMARFLNNAFGQGLLATPLQVAAAYGALVNGGYYIQPTILAGYFDSKTEQYYHNQTKIVSQIFRPETAEQMKDALFTVMELNPDYINIARVEGKTLGGKSGTAQIAYRGHYMQGNGWTNGSFVGLITRDDPKYIVVVQVRRPRATLWGAQTAGKVFSDVAKFLLGYSFIES